MTPRFKKENHFDAKIMLGKGSAVADLNFIYSEKATKFCEIYLLLLTTVHTVKSKGKISQNFVAFSEYMNFKDSVVYGQPPPLRAHSTVYNFIDIRD